MYSHIITPSSFMKLSGSVVIIHTTSPLSLRHTISRASIPLGFLYRPRLVAFRFLARRHRNLDVHAVTALLRNQLFKLRNVYELPLGCFPWFLLPRLSNDYLHSLAIYTCDDFSTGVPQDPAGIVSFVLGQLDKLIQYFTFCFLRGYLVPAYYFFCNCLFLSHC